MLTDSKEILLPYGTYSTFKNTIERFKDATVPTNLNRHVLDDVAGGAFSALSTGLKFLGLMDKDRGALTKQFRDLVEARKKGDTEYQSLLLTLIEEAYKPMLGNFDVEAGTLPDLEKKFRDAGMPQGQMTTKAVRFYIAALKDCGVPVSEHITKKRPRTKKAKDANAPKKTKKAKKDSDSTNGGGGVIYQEPETNLGNYARLPIPGIEGAFIQYPKNLTETGVLMFEAMISVLRTYAQAREPRKGSEGKKK
jgi:hypothetical protein